MSSNSRFQSDAEMRAEAALRDGENAIIITPIINQDVAHGFYNSATLINTKDPRKSGNWINLNGKIATLTPAKYIVEKLNQSCLSNTTPSSITPCIPGPVYLTMSTYRIWSLATDSKGAARIAQSTYRKIDNPNPALNIGGNTIPSGTSYHDKATRIQRLHPHGSFGGTGNHCHSGDDRLSLLCESGSQIQARGGEKRLT